MIARLGALALCAALASPVAAHDFWRDAFTPRYYRELAAEHARAARADRWRGCFVWVYVRDCGCWR